MSSDPKKPFDAPPGETPELLQQEVPLERRRRVPSFEELQTDPARQAIPQGTVPARPSSLETGVRTVPPNLTPRAPMPSPQEPTTETERPAFPRPPVTAPMPPPAAPQRMSPGGLNLPTSHSAVPPGPARTTPGGLNLPRPAPGVPGSGLPPPPAGTPRSSPSGSGLAPPPAGGIPLGSPSSSGVPRSSPSGSGFPPPPPAGIPRSSPSGSGLAPPPAGGIPLGSPSNSGFAPPAGIPRSSPSGSSLAPPTGGTPRSTASGAGLALPPAGGIALGSPSNSGFAPPSGAGLAPPPGGIPRSSPSNSSFPPPPPAGISSASGAGLAPPPPGGIPRSSPSGSGFAPPPPSGGPRSPPNSIGLTSPGGLLRPASAPSPSEAQTAPSGYPVAESITSPMPAVTRQPQVMGAEPLPPTGVLPSMHRPAPPSPTEYAQNRPSMQNLPQVTPMTPFQGALPPEGHRTPSKPQPPHQPGALRASEPELERREKVPVPLGAEDDEVPMHDEPKTVLEANRAPAPVAPPAPPAPRAPSASFSTIPPVAQLPPEMLVTQPGLPGPFAKGARHLPQGQAVPQRPASLPELPATVLRPAAEEAPVAPPAPAFEAPAFEAPPGAVTAEPASLWRRLGAWLTDLLFVSVMVLGLAFVAIEFVAPKNVPPAQQLISIALPAAALGALLAFVYTALFAFLWDGRTPGRRMMGIHLVDASGHAPGALRSLIRAALSLVSFALFLSGFWLALFDRHGQTLHDKLTRTFVVKLQDA